LFSVIPVVDQQIEIPPELYISYAMSDERKASIGNGRINGFFDANVENLGRDHQIKDERFTQFGDLNIDEGDDAAPYQF